MIDAVENTTVPRVPEPEMRLISGMKRLGEFVRGDEVENPELSLHLGQGGNSTEIGAEEANETNCGVIMMPDSSNVGLARGMVGLSFAGLVLFGEVGELLPVPSAVHHHVDLDVLVLEPLVLRSIGLLEHEGAGRCHPLGPRTEIDLAVSSIRDGLLNQGRADALDDTTVERLAVGLADIRRGLIRLGKEHCLHVSNCVGNKAQATYFG